jgi:hypothetical protein
MNSPTLGMVGAPMSSQNNRKASKSVKKMTALSARVSELTRRIQQSKLHNNNARTTPRGGSRKARKAKGSSSRKPFPVPGTVSFAGTPMNAVSEFQFTTSAAGLGVVVFNPSLAWTDSRYFQQSGAPSGQIGTTIYSSPAAVGTDILIGHGSPGYSGQYPSSGNIDDWAGHIQWIGSTAHVYYNGTELNKGGTISVISGETSYSLVEFDYGTGNFVGSNASLMTTSAGMSTSHHLGAEKHIHFLPHGAHLGSLTEIPERMQADMNDSTYKFLPDIDTSYAENGFTCAFVLKAAGGAQPFTVRMCHRYRTRMYQHLGGGPVKTLSPPTNSFAADPSRMAKLSASIAAINQNRSTNGTSPLVTDSGNSPGLVGQLVGDVLGPGAEKVVEGLVGGFVKGLL